MTSRKHSNPLSLVAAVVAAVSAACVTPTLAQHTIALVRARGLLPRWDLATHLGHGWADYDFLVSGQIHRLLWDLWLQGYWPPGLSIYQVPFYLVLGGEMTSGLWSSPVAFVLVAGIGAAILVRQWGSAGFLPASGFVALLVSSPFLLAYASVTMTEILGSLGQLLVVLSYLAYRQRPGPGTARLFAISLTLLFFIKYNYLVLLAGPLVLHEGLERAAGSSPWKRVAGAWGAIRRVLASTTGSLLLLYAVVLVLISITGGFEFHLLGRRVSMRSIGNSGHVVLYALLLRVWYLHRRGRIDWAGLSALDPRVRPLLRWFVLPVTVWLASPYPNHIRDVANLVINRPLGDPTVEAGTATYVESLRTGYFFAEWTLALVLVTFVVSAVRYQRQPPVFRWLILAVPLQFAAIALHQTRFPRFLLLTVVLLCLAAASEVGRWLSGWERGRLVAGVLAPVVLATGVLAGRKVVTEERFRVVALEHYTDSERLRLALGGIKGELTEDDRLLIVGQSNELSPALFRWELGPPSGVPCFPLEGVGAGRLDVADATRVLLLEPLDPAHTSLDAAAHHLARRGEVMDAVDRGELHIRREYPVPDMHVALRLYERTTAPRQFVPCR